MTRSAPTFDRLWRLAALFVLCGLIYYFSFDNGRATSKAIIGRLQEQTRRLETENESLRRQLAVLGRELADLQGTAEDGAGAGSSGGSSGQAPAGSSGAASGGASPAPPAGGADAGAAGPKDEKAPGAFIGEAGAAASSGERGLEPPSGGRGEPSLPAASSRPSAASPPSANYADSASPRPEAAGEPSLRRLTVRNEESRLILDGQVLLSVEDIDSLDRTATVRMQQLDSGRREARTMAPGEILSLERGGAGHRLLLDQLKGSVAVFILISP